MKAVIASFSVGVLTLLAGLAGAADTPSVPPNLKEAEAQGLHRLRAEDLKPLLAGVVESEGAKGSHRLTYAPDGSVKREGGGYNDLAGKWRIDGQANSYCLAFNFKKGYRESCFAVFQSSDGARYLDYDLADGFHAHTWHQAPR